ncbi:MAG: thioredoxin family protein [Candidatus Bathyarchaeia archaeon]|jgi:nicotinic acid phosphoribosyltransferase
MPLNLNEIRTRTVSANDYINNLEEPFKEKFLTRKQTYQLNPEAINQLKAFAGKYVIIAFSATWCKDCALNIPVLAMINETAAVEVRVFGGLKKDPLDQVHKWRIPPSPQEVETLNVEKIPLIIVADAEGNEIGRIIENPSHQPTLEQEISEIIRSKQ